MSNSTWKKCRRAVKPYAEKMDLNVRAGMKIPFHIRVVGFFFKSVRTNYINRWEKTHRRAVRTAMKYASHLVKDQIK